MRREAAGSVLSRSPPLKRNRLATSPEGAHHMVFDSLLANSNFFRDFSISLAP